MFLITLLLVPAPQLNQLGADAFRRAEYAAAQAIFELAWRRAPHANTASNLAATARRFHDWSAAEHWFTQVIDLRRAQLGERHPDTAIAFNNRAEARIELGRWREALEDLTEAADRCAPRSADHAVILHNTGALYRRQRQHDHARQALEESLAIRRGDSQTSRLLAETLIDLAADALDRARLRDARTLCQTARQAAPGWAPAQACLDRVNAVAVDVQ